MIDQLSRFTLRWAVDVSAWNPGNEEWQLLLGLLPAEDAQAVQRFKFQDDQKRALVSRLLQRQCVALALGIPLEAVAIQRTRGRKPFYAGAAQHPAAPNFNFNVSHEGCYVVLASEPVCICGVDVAAPQRIRRTEQEPLEIFFERFKRQFTPAEWEAMRGAGPDDASREAAFRQHWSLKEALVKARGDGLAFDMGRAELRIDGDNATARLWLDGAEQPRWRFYLHELRAGHWVSVARATPEAVVDSWGVFKSTLQRQEMADSEWQEHLDRASPPFEVLQIADLLPEQLRGRHADVS